MHGVNSVILIFHSDRALYILRENHTRTVDGTFSAVLEPFRQPYAIIYIVKNHHVIPAAFVIIKFKNLATYINLFPVTKHSIDNLDPRSLKTDFE